MSVESPPFAQQGQTYSAEILRRAFGTILQRGSTIGSVAGGLVGPEDMAVTAGSGMQVLVAPGEAWIPGTSVSTQAGYYSRVSSSTAVSIAASNASNPRIDRVSAIVKDKTYSGTEETFTAAVETGTPTAGATLVNKNGVAAAPASSLTLAYVLVPVSSVSVTNGNIENVARLLSLVGSLPFTIHSGNTTALAGETVLVFPSPGTVTLPSTEGAPPTGVWNVSSGNVTVVDASTAPFRGDFLGVAGPTSIVLTPGQHVVCQRSGAVQYIIAGEPKREQKYEVKNYTKTELEAGVEVSATRDVQVAALKSSSIGVTTIGGVAAPSLGLQAPVRVPAGQKLKCSTTDVNNELYVLTL